MGGHAPHSFAWSMVPIADWLIPINVKLTTIDVISFELNRSRVNTSHASFLHVALPWSGCVYLQLNEMNVTLAVKHSKQ